MELLSIGKGVGFLDKKNAVKISNQLQTSSAVFIIKTHDVFSIENKSNIAYIYSYRDLRDVAISLKKKIPKDDALIINMINESVDQYNNLKNLKDSIKIRYEKLMESEEVVLRFLCKELALPIIDDAISSVVSNNSIESILKLYNK